MRQYHTRVAELTCTDSRSYVLSPRILSSRTASPTTSRAYIPHRMNPCTSIGLPLHKFRRSRRMRLRMLHATWLMPDARTRLA
eukprot:14598578-Heterocapsa_arctica.AAC.1